MSRHESSPGSETPLETTEGRDDFFGHVAEGSVKLTSKGGSLRPAGIEVTPRGPEEKVELPKACYELLQKYWGFKQFLTDQAQIIDLTLRGDGKNGVKDLVYSLPTSGGKSLAFQLPALYRYFEDPSLPLTDRPVTVVISPHVALIRNQAAKLHRSDAPFAFFHSLQNDEERSLELSKVVEGKAAIIYMTPERAISERCLREIFRVEDLQKEEGKSPLNIAAFVFDEAQNFDTRNRYRIGYSEKLGMMLDKYFSGELGKRPQKIVCTATAPETIRLDIAQTIRLHPDETYRYTAMADRVNLTYHADEFASFQAKLAPAVKLLKELGKGEQAIAYCPTRASTEKAERYFKRHGIKNIEYYHAGIGEPSVDDKQANDSDASTAKSRRETTLAKRRERIAREDRFTTLETEVEVATIAFGAGLDYPNVRKVILLYMPPEMETLIQLSGRAGRDSRPADVHYLISGTDIAQAEYFIQAGHPPRAFVKSYVDYLLKRFDNRADKKLDTIYFDLETELPDSGAYKKWTPWKRAALMMLIEEGLVDLEGRRLKFIAKTAKDFDDGLPTEEEFRIERLRAEKGLNLVAFTLSEGLKKAVQVERDGIGAGASATKGKDATDASIRELMLTYLRDGLPDFLGTKRDLVKLFPSLMANIHTVSGLVAGQDYDLSRIIRQIKRTAKKAEEGGKRVLSKSPYADFVDMTPKEVLGIIRQAEALDLVRLHTRGGKPHEKTVLSITSTGVSELSSHPEAVPPGVKLSPSHRYEDLAKRMGSSIENQTLVNALAEWNMSVYQKIRSTEALQKKLGSGELVGVKSHDVDPENFAGKVFRILGEFKTGAELTASYVGKKNPSEVDSGDIRSFLSFLFNDPLSRHVSSKLGSD